MSLVPNEFVTVDMRDLKVALIERSRMTRMSVSSLVRNFVATGLGREKKSVSADLALARNPLRTVKLSIRISAAEAMQLSEGATRAGLSRPAYLAELIARPPQIISSVMRSEQLALVAATNAELSTLSRNLRHLTTLLSRSSWQAAHEYRGMLDTMAGNVRRHLSLSSALLGEMRPRRSLLSVRSQSADRRGGERRG